MVFKVKIFRCRNSSAAEKEQKKSGSPSGNSSNGQLKKNSF